MEMQSTLSESGIAIPIIIMTAHGDMPMVRKALKAGAFEFLIKPFKDEEILEAVEQAFALDRAHRRAGDRYEFDSRPSQRRLTSVSAR